MSIRFFAKLNSNTSSRIMSNTPSLCLNQRSFIFIWWSPEEDGGRSPWVGLPAIPHAPALTPLQLQSEQRKPLTSCLWSCPSVVRFWKAPQGGDLYSSRPPLRRRRPTAGTNCHLCSWGGNLRSFPCQRGKERTGRGEHVPRHLAL